MGDDARKKRAYDSVAKCLSNYHLGKHIGSGVYGDVFEACKIPTGTSGLPTAAGECKLSTSSGASETKQKFMGGGYAVKVVEVDNDGQLLTSAMIDEEALKALQDYTWVNSRGQIKPLVPKLYYSGQCSSYQVMVMDEYQMNAYDLGLKQFQDAIRAAVERKDNRFPAYTDFSYLTDGKDSLLFTADQFQDLFLIAETMDRAGIIHGDLNPKQYLCKPSAKQVAAGVGAGTNFPWSRRSSTSVGIGGVSQNWDIVVSDFGLARTWGWSYFYGCPRPEDEPVSATGVNRLGPDMADYFNRWQLSMWMSNSGANTFVEDPITGNYIEFTGITGLPAWWKDNLVSRCPTLVKLSANRNDLQNVGLGIGANRSRQSARSVSRSLGVSIERASKLLNATAGQSVFTAMAQPRDLPLRPSSTIKSATGYTSYSQLLDIGDQSIGDPAKLAFLRRAIDEYLAIR